jgi:hypothetical protein
MVHIDEKVFPIHSRHQMPLDVTILKTLLSPLDVTILKTLLSPLHLPLLLFM